MYDINDMWTSYAILEPMQYIELSQIIRYFPTLLTTHNS